jgi:undecaprenyl-diphosphatase
LDFLRSLAEIRTPFLDFLFGAITALGEETAAIAVVCLLFWCVDKRLAYGLGLSFFISGIAVQSMKVMFRIERPWVLDPGFEPVASAMEAATGYSFPSGHAQSAGAVFGALGFSAKKRWQMVCCFAAAVLVGFSRLYLGVHTPVDVVAALFISLLAAFIVARTDVFKDGLRSNLILAIALAAFASAAIALAVALRARGIIAEEFAADCCKAAGAGLGLAAGLYCERRYIRFGTAARGVVRQAVKFLLGIAVLLAIKEGLKPLLGGGMAAGSLRYFVVVFWVTAVYPLIIKKFFEAKEPA